MDEATTVREGKGDDIGIVDVGREERLPFPKHGRWGPIDDKLHGGDGGRKSSELRGDAHGADEDKMTHMQSPAPTHRQGAQAREEEGVWVNVTEEAIKISKAIQTKLASGTGFAKAKELRHFRIFKLVQRVNEISSGNPSREAAASRRCSAMSRVRR